MADRFMTALRGYDMNQVDAALRQADEALASGSETLRVAAQKMLENVAFRQRLRGYARDQVDRAVRERLSQLG
ncbi:DivIVA domain-containing protein [Actinoplanes sp. TRM 88003]|uniref:DivIVA domain-containing protein n=1 Tax=Paractinoplanes aksuensis TaxID=2939490 RepID=A0ABT1E757_9ACTN|nr:DivIVA domain-containing protein [Actinoplanes aksuensis]MCO8277646.1 DivIVA domain-containing protein [Actinoplanes aksuensis]